MRFLKSIFWVTLLVAMVLFAVNNWQPVSVKLWGGLRLDTKLPALVIAAFFAGFLPLYLWHRGLHWRLRRKISSLESNASPPPVTFVPPQTEATSQSGSLS
jgi:lipopolysaccharide assembly protein A